MIRIATSNDIPYINYVLRQFNQAPINYINSEYLIYENKGIINYKILDKEAEIYYLYVEEKYRNTGIASNLLEKALEYCKSKMCESVFLEVRKSNVAAINLYKKFGFYEISERINYYNNPKENAVILKKKLGD